MESRPLFVPALRRSQAWVYFLLAVVVVALYTPSVRFGLMWDDPRYYQGVAAFTSLSQIFTSPQPPTNQFYRPAAVLYGRWLTSRTGVVNAPLAHVLQIGAHLVATLASVPALQALGFEGKHARLTALCFAVFPLSYYAVAWPQNQQPMLLMWLLLAILAAHRFCRSRSAAFLGSSLAAYALSLLFQEGAAPYVFVFFWLAVREGWKNSQTGWQRWPLLHLGLLGLYALVWGSMPTQRGVTGQGFQSVVLAYFLQGLVFPVSRLLAGWAADWPLAGLFSVFGTLWLLLAFGLWRWGAGRAAVLSWAWIAAGVLPLWAGLSWGYAQLGPRLLYPAALGIAGIWGGWMVLAFTARGWRRALGAVILIGVLGVSLQQLWEFQRLFQVGTQHLARAVDVLSAAPHKRLLFVNFPDRLEILPPPYPRGFWGLILAPVVQDLADYAHAARGQSAEDRSLTSFVTGASERAAWPYRVDMRGVNSSPPELFEAALRVDAVYLSDYVSDGSLRLREVGAVRRMGAASSPNPLGRFGEAVQLVDAEISWADGLSLRLVWRCLQPLQPDDTLFVHFWREGVFVSGADGDSLGGLLPPAAWQVGTEVVDLRRIEPMRLEPGVYVVRVGIYNRTSGLRYPALAAEGGLSENGIWVGEFSVP